MLKELIENGLCSFYEKFDRWEDAVRAAAEPLVKAGAVGPAYGESIVENVKKFGPYIVIAPDIAIPHAADPENVYRTAVCFMKTKAPVVFEPQDREKDVRLFFTLASRDEEKHLENIQALMELFEDEEKMARLAQAESAEEVRALL